MSFKKKILVGIMFLAVYVVAILAYAWFGIVVPGRERKEFLSKLPGEVVYTKRDSSGVSNIWKINADGTGNTLIYKHDLGGEAKNYNSTKPVWIKEGKSIIFKAMGEKGWSIYEIKEGGGVSIFSNEEDITQHKKRYEQIIIEAGDIYFIDKSGDKHLIFDSKYDGKFYTGASSVSVGPNGEYILFEHNIGEIKVCGVENLKCFLLAYGSDPDWKY